MDILETLQQKREVSRRQAHPLASLSLHNKYNYCFGLAILAKGNMKTLRELSAPFSYICKTLGISLEQQEELISDLNNQFDVSLDQLMQLLFMERRWAYCFLIDLLKLSEYADFGTWYCDEVIKQFCYILKIPKETLRFMQKFLKERKNENSAKVQELVSQFERDSDALDYDLLRYMNPEYVRKNHYKELILNTGGIARIEMETEIDGDMIVSNGTRVIISNTSLLIGGSISVESGRLKITNSLIEAKGEERLDQYLIETTKQHTVKIEDSTLQMHHLCPAYYQADGNLSIKNSMFCESVGDYAVNFGGKRIEMEDVIIKDAQNGGIRVVGRAQTDLYHCQFLNCKAEHGGAVYVSSTEELHIRECNFENCTAKFLGSAIYVHYKTYGQKVLGCTYRDCEPKTDMVFNVYENQ